MIVLVSNNREFTPISLTEFPGAARGSLERVDQAPNLVATCETGEAIRYF